MITFLMLMAVLGPQDLSPADKKKGEQLRAAVEKAPEDPAANLALGKFLCFTAGDWKEGLPFLAKGGDDQFAHTARRDLEPKENALFSIEVADMWLLLEQKNKPIQSRIRERALYHFAEAWPKISDQVWKDKTRERLRTLLQRAPESKTTGPAPANWSAVNAVLGTDRQYARTGMSSVKIAPPDPAKKNFQGGLCSELYPCSPGAKIKFSAWVFTGGSEGIDEIRIKIRNAKQSGGEHLTMVTVKTSPDLPYWTKVEGEATAPEGANNVEVSFKRAQNATGFIFVDDFSLTTDGKELLKNGSFEK